MDDEDDDEFFLTGDQMALWDVLSKIKTATTLDEAHRLAEEGLKTIKEFAL